MKLIILAVLVGISAAQLLPHRPPGYLHDRHLGYTFEYHPNQGGTGIFLIKNTRACYFINIAHDSDLDRALHNADQRHAYEDKLIPLLESHDTNNPLGIFRMTRLDEIIHHRDIFAAIECLRHTLYDIEKPPQP